MEILSWLAKDIQIGGRNLRKGGGFTLLCVLTLALGIGSATVIFSVVYNAMVQPFPYKDGNQLAHFSVNGKFGTSQMGRAAFSMEEFSEYREQNHTFEDMIGEDPVDLIYTTREGSLELDGTLVTANIFDFLGIPPLFGRQITLEDVKPGAPPVFAMSYRLWNSQFNHDPNILGTAMMLNGKSRTLVAIMPPRFLFADRDIWIPISPKPGEDTSAETNGALLSVFIIGKLKPAVSLATAASDLTAVSKSLAQVYPQAFPKDFIVTVVTLREDIVGPVKAMIYTLVAAVGLLLLIACGNVANLLLVKATAREKEMAIRVSMGASRWRLVRQLLVESLLLAIAACVTGAFFAGIGLKVVTAAIPRDNIPAESVFELNSLVLIFALVLGGATTLLCGLAPALHLVRPDLNRQLKDAGRGTNVNVRQGKLRSTLVLIEIAVSIILLIGAGLMLRSLYALHHVEMGFDSHNIFPARIVANRGRYGSVDEKKLFVSQVLDRIKALPGVSSATESSTIPPFRGPQTTITILGKENPAQSVGAFELCSDEYFQTLKIGLKQGRLLSKNDVEFARRVAVVNQAFARNFFGDENPIGKQFKFGLFDYLRTTPHDAYFEIIGVVGDSRNQGVRTKPVPEAFIPYTFVPLGDNILLVKTAMEPASMLESIRREIWSVDRNVTITFSGSLDSQLQRFVFSETEFALHLLGIFATLALVLTAIGIFSVIAYTVSLQTHEIGVRMALGAQRGDILGMVLKNGLKLILAGIIIGELASLGLTQLIKSQIWGVPAIDVWTFGVVASLLLAVGAIGCLLPARGATRVNPIVALHYE